MCTASRHGRAEPQPAQKCRIFADGTQLALVQPAGSRVLQLLHWDGTSSHVVAEVEHAHRNGLRHGLVAPPDLGQDLVGRDGEICPVGVGGPVYGPIADEWRQGPTNRPI